MLRGGKLKMLFVGDDWYGSNATSLRNGFIQQGVDVTTVNTFDVGSARASSFRRVFNKISRSAYEDLARTKVSRSISAALNSPVDFDVLFVFKGDYVEAEILERFDGIKIHYHPDDSANPDNTSKYYRSAEDNYDVHVTTKLHNIQELEGRSKAPVVFVKCAFDPAWHFPQSFATESRVGLIGTRRPDRVDFIVECARTTSQKMLIAGSGWGRDRTLRRLAEVSGPKFGLDFSKYAAKAPIQLGVLNSANRDTHTCRTFEVPAAGALFIGERTAEHEDIFSAPNSALLYGSPEEALEMIAFAESNSAFVDRARRRGYELITSGCNTYADRAGEILKYVAELS